MLPKASAYGSYPKSGEIDIMEARGNLNLKQGNTHIGVEQYASTLHAGFAENAAGLWSQEFVKNTKSGKGLNKGFHTYSMEWTPSIITIITICLKH